MSQVSTVFTILEYENSLQIFRQSKIGTASVVGVNTKGAINKTKYTVLNDCMFKIVISFLNPDNKLNDRYLAIITASSRPPGKTYMVSNMTNV